MCGGAKTAWESLGQVDYGRKSSEQANVKFRHSLYFVRNVFKGSVLTNKDVKSIRLGYGLQPKYIDQIIGKKATENISAGTPVQWKLISQ